MFIIKKVGLQGGVGSFNDITFGQNYDKIKQLIFEQISLQNDINFGDLDIKPKYLLTTQNVLRELNDKNIDYGLFALLNSLGGVVLETTTCLGKYHFNFLDSFKTQISHSLMKRKDQNLKTITQIMAHEQVFRQCKNKLTKYFPNLKQVNGIHNLTDNGSIALALAKNELPNTAILMSPILSKIYDLDIIQDKLEDDEANYTTFLFVS